MAFGKIDGAEPSTVTFSLRTVTHDIGGATQHQEIVTLGGAVSSLAVAEVTNATPASTAWALAVRDVVPQSTVVSVSTGSVRVHQSTGADLQATVAQGSTVWAVQLSSLAGRVLVDQNSTVWVVQVSSVAGIVTVNNNDGAGNALASATAQPSTNARGLVVRPVVNGILSTTVVITSTNSTALYDLISSVAGTRHKVFAYFVGSTHTSPSTLVFVSSNVIDRWAVNFGSGSSGITGANLALSPPAWLFNTDVANALRVRIEGGSSAASTVIARISLSWFGEA